VELRQVSLQDASPLPGDPSQATGSEDDRLRTFRRVRDEIARAVADWLAGNP
jgi:hypothetical protein